MKCRINIMKKLEYIFDILYGIMMFCIITYLTLNAIAGIILLFLIDLTP